MLPGLHCFYTKVSQRPDDMSEILAYYFSKGNTKLANAMKRGFRAKLESMDPYLIDKYKMSKKNISLVDLVNLTHPAPDAGREKLANSPCTNTSECRSIQTFGKW